MNPEKKLYLEFVQLTDDEHAKLLELLGAEALAFWLEELNDYLGQSEKNRRKYDSHYHTIRSWARRKGFNRSNSSNRSNDEAQRAADRVIEALRDPANKYRPSFDERTVRALYTAQLKRQARWSDMHEKRHDQAFLEELRADIIKNY